MMAPQKALSTISLGNWIMLATLVFGGGGAFATINNRLDRIEDSIVVTNATVSVNESRAEKRSENNRVLIASNEGRVRSLEVSSAARESEIRGIISTLVRIERKLDEYAERERAR